MYFLNYKNTLRTKKIHHRPIHPENHRPMFLPTATHPPPQPSSHGGGATHTGSCLIQICSCPNLKTLHLALRQLPHSPNHHHHPVFSLAFCRRFCSCEERPLGTLELSRFAPPRSLFDSFPCSYFKSRSGGWPYYNLIYYLVAASFEPRLVLQ